MAKKKKKWHKRNTFHSGDKYIIDTYQAIELDDPDISTERLLALTADMCGCDEETVIYALMRASKRMGYMQ